jgi:hypothetical protein
LPLPGVMVSAQIYYPDEEGLDRKDQVVVWTSTVTDENGEYKLFLEPGTFNIVAHLTHYYPEVKCLEPLAAGEIAGDHDFTLDSAPTGHVSGDVDINNADLDQHVTISFRQFWDCDGNEATTDDVSEFEVTSVNVGDGGDYDVILPAGFYDIVASSFGKTTLAITDVEVEEGEITPLPIEF